MTPENAPVFGRSAGRTVVGAVCHLEEAHRRIRSVVPHLDHDRLQTTDIESAFALVREGALADLVG